MSTINWTYEELVLALDLYFKLPFNVVSSAHPDIIALSKELRSWVPEIIDERFRSSSSIALKLSSFLILDGHRLSKGNINMGWMDKGIFAYYKEKPHALDEEVQAIKEERAKTRNLKKYKIQEVFYPFQKDIGFDKELSAIKRFKKRNGGVIGRKKQLIMSKFGKLCCDVCSFDFKATYGRLGEFYMECHPKFPLSEIDLETEVTLNDLSMICSNCRNMLYLQDTLSVAGLREIIMKKGIKGSERTYSPDQYS